MSAPAPACSHRTYELHACLKQVKRSAGRSSVAAAAYRSASRLGDERTGLQHDYTRKQGIEHTQIYAPADAPAWAQERASLWNAVERKENRSNSTMAHELVIGFPAEFTLAHRREAGEIISKQLVERYGCAVDIAYHRPHRNGDERNFHAHILFTTRSFDPQAADGWSRTKFRDLSSDKAGGEGEGGTRGSREVKSLRAFSAMVMNEIAEREGLAVLTEYLSYEERGIDRTPTQHIGPHANKIEQAGQTSERGNVNRSIRAANDNRTRIERAQRVIDLEARRLEREITRLERADITRLLAQKHKHFAIQKEHHDLALKDYEAAKDKLGRVSWSQQVMGVHKQLEADLKEKELTLAMARQRLDELARSWAVTSFLRGRSKDEALHVAAGELRAQKLEAYEQQKEAYAQHKADLQRLQEEQQRLEGQARTVAAISGRSDALQQEIGRLQEVIKDFEHSRAYKAEQRYLDVRERQEARIASLEAQPVSIPSARTREEGIDSADDGSESWLYSGSDLHTGEDNQPLDRSLSDPPLDREAAKEQARQQIREQMDQETSKERGGRDQDES
ncbi:MAG: MobA/MobL family protein [Alphaproteobacteria bacterium]|nr:MobA/MobL family protein [Alphaproteobacteria bacterium]MBP7904474.1 MobA/MobL family protein [Alphaproteobacteria bacterium]